MCHCLSGLPGWYQEKDTDSGRQGQIERTLLIRSKRSWTPLCCILSVVSCMNSNEFKLSNTDFTRGVARQHGTK